MCQLRSQLDSFGSGIPNGRYPKYGTSLKQMTAPRVSASFSISCRLLAIKEKTFYWTITWKLTLTARRCKRPSGAVRLLSGGLDLRTSLRAESLI